jgi:hypothetical protein
MIKKRFKEFTGSGTLTIFDIDETLFHTKANVAVMKDGKVVRSLDNQEFNTYKLKAGESFDFKEFRSAEVFRKTSTPIARMVEKAKILVKSRNNAASRAIIVTARADFDDKEMFLQTFRDHGLPIDQMHVERSGNLGISSPADLKAFLELQGEYPNIEFEAWFVKSDGSVKRVK